MSPQFNIFPDVKHNLNKHSFYINLLFFLRIFGADQKKRTVNLPVVHFKIPVKPSTKAKYP